MGCNRNLTYTRCGHGCDGNGMPSSMHVILWKRGAVQHGRNQDVGMHVGAWMFCEQNALEHGRNWNVGMDAVGPGCKPGLRDGGLQMSMDVVRCGHGWCGNGMQSSMDVNRMWAWIFTGCGPE